VGWYGSWSGYAYWPVAPCTEVAESETYCFIGALNGGAENTGPENARPENEGPSVKGSPYLITGRTDPELIPVLGSQPAGDVSHKPDRRLPLLSDWACSYPRSP